MQNINFDALGTKWSILIDSPLNRKIETKIIKTCANFENNYSRFKPKSLLSRYNLNKKIKLTKEFSQLLNFGQKLEKLSNGFFNCNAGKHLGKLGYGKGIQDLDFGAYGKGWLIDDVASLLKNEGFKHFLINAGGDIFATKKSSNESWNVALEHPTNNKLVIGTVELKNKALAASSPHKRSWDNHNHLVNGKTGESVNKDKSVFTLANTAKIADGLATTLNIIPEDIIKKLAQNFDVEYLIIKDNQINKSQNFDCIIFS